MDDHRTPGSCSPSDRRPSRRHVLHRTVAAMVAVVTLLSSTVVLTNAAPAAAASAVELTRAESEQLRLLNDYRRARGLPALSVDASVQTYARAWARHLGDVGSLSHDPDQRAECYTASDTCSGWAENVGVADSQQRVFQLFTESSGHARNMRLGGDGGDPYRVGVAVYQAGGRTWVVQKYFRCRCANGPLADVMNRNWHDQLAFASALFHDFLDRSGSASELDAVAAPLVYGVPRGSRVVSLAYSDAWVGALVDQFYQWALGRLPDDDGRAYWIDLIRRGHSPAAVASLFFASDEYYRRAGGTDSRWVRDLYQTLLGRTPDDDGLRYWVSVTRSTSRSAVAYAFYQSVESRQRRVVGLFEALLGRRPDRDGLSYWTSVLGSGQDVQLAAFLAASDEYLHRAVQRFG